MARWMNLQRIEKFENPMRLNINCEKSGCLYLAEPSLTASWLAEKIWAIKAWYFKSLLQIEIFDFPLCLPKVLHYFNNFDALLMFVQANTATSLFYTECEILRSPMITYWSLPYSNTVLYDRFSHAILTCRSICGLVKCEITGKVLHHAWENI